MGTGTEFQLTLPVVVGFPPSIAGHEGCEDERTTCRVLVVDDAKATADTLALFLETEGFQATVAYDGERAVEMAATVRPDIACLDIGLPGIDGNETARRIRALLPNIVLIAITGWGADDDRLMTKEAGFDDPNG